MASCVATARAPSADARVTADDAGESDQEKDAAVIAEIAGGIGITEDEDGEAGAIDEEKGRWGKWNSRHYRETSRGALSLFK